MRSLSRFVAAMLTAVTAISFAIQPPERAALPNFDKRPTGAAVAPAEQQTGAAKLLKSLPAATVDLDPLIGSPKYIRRTTGFLTGPGGKGGAVGDETAARFAGTSHRAVKAFVTEHAALFGHDATLLVDADIKRSFETAHNGMKTVVWQQQLDRIPIHEAVFIAHTTKRDELVNISSQYLPAPDKAANRGAGDRAKRGEPLIPVGTAMACAATNLGLELQPAELVSLSVPTTPDKKQLWSHPALSGETEARLVWLPMSRDQLQLCWQVTLTVQSRGEMFRLLVDAATGDVLLRQGLTEYISDASYRVYTSDSPTPFSPGHSTPLSTQPPSGARSLLTLPALDTNASPNGWIDDGVNETRGNNVDAHLDRTGDNIPDGRPQGSPFRVFDFPMDLTQQPVTYTNAAVAQLFYRCNWIHDRLYQLGFTEAAGNFQINNFGRGGLGNDPVQADAQDGGGFNNANFSTPSDGSAGRMQMYLWNYPSPMRDGDFDSEIVIHEYVHGLSNRRVGGGVGLSSLQSRGMGEGWSDWYALTLLAESGDAANGAWAKGGYSTYLLSGQSANYYFGIRRYPYSTDMSKSPLTFKDIDPTRADPHGGVPRSTIIGTSADAVHNQGEVWCVTLWEARANLVAKHGFTVGNELILRLVTDGMNLSPANPSFLQSRDAILQASLVYNGGADLPELWSAFAKRGMGASAVAPNSSSTIGVLEAYDIPDTLNVFPGNGFTASGPVGGPFTPSHRGYTLLNTATGSLSWAASVSDSWLTVSPAAGTIAAGSTNSTSISISSAANSLPAGIYSGTVRFTNVTSGNVHTRTIVARIGQPEHFTENFDAADFDVDNQVLTFTPDGTTNFYSVCREPTNSFPTDPAGGTTLTLSGHSSVTITTPSPISIYGLSATTVYINAEGHITLGSADTSGSLTLLSHFSRRRISASGAHFHPNENGGLVSWRALSNRVAITFQRILEYGTFNTNNFQFELFYDGRIRLTHLKCDTTYGIVGLSAGSGVPVGFIESDLSGYGPCLLPITVTVPVVAREGDGVLTNMGQVRIFAPAPTNMLVALTSSAPAQVSVPATAMILAGQMTGTFDLTVIDDTALDGVQPVTISATMPAYEIASDTILVNDNETATLSVASTAVITEGGATPGTGTVIASAPPATDITVSLSSSDTSEVQVPSTVVIPAGQTSVSFALIIPNDGLIDGPQLATITAQVPFWTSGSTNITIRDDEATNLVVVLPASAREGNGTLLNAGSVRLSGTLPTNLLVSLSSSDESELVVPLSVTIPAGQTSTVYSITVVEDSDVDSSQIVTVTATSPAFVSGTRNITITDNESPPEPFQPSPAHLATNIIQTSDLFWASGATGGEVFTNEVYFGTNPDPGPAELLGTTSGTSWVLPQLAPLTTYYWKVVARKIGVTPGPVWQFTTRGVDRFDFAAVPTTQYVGEPFGVTITARDSYSAVVSNFPGPVRLSSSGTSAGVGGTLLESPVHTAMYTGGPYTAGYTIRPNADLRVTHVRHYAGTKVTIWSDFGALLASQNVVSIPGTWLETPLSNPITLSSGVVYRVATYTGGTTYYGRYDLSNTFPHGTILQHCESYGDAFPITMAASWRWFFVDLRYVMAGPVMARLSPTNSGAFTNGVWAGNVTVLEPRTNLALRADDGAGHTGQSGPLTVLLRNDIALSVSDSPDPVSLGATLAYTITVTNIGPLAAAGVVVTNLLPPNAVLVSAVSSQGTVATNAGRVEAALGTLPGSSSGTVTITALCLALGTMTNHATVSRSDTDPYPDNNTVATVTTVASPIVGIADATVFEGTTLSRTASFVVRVSPPPALPITVLYNTSDDSARGPGDYTPTNGLLRFEAGETQKVISVAITADPAYEDDETFYATLNSITNATLTNYTAVGTILNDDSMPTLTIGDVTLREGNSGSNQAVFTITLSAASGRDTWFEVATEEGNADSGRDFTGHFESFLMPAGMTSTSVTVYVFGELEIEPDEVFYAHFYGVDGALALKREGYCLIENDDGLPGMAHRFVWDPIPSPQVMGAPFTATIRALDAFQNPATLFTGTVAVAGFAESGTATNTLLAGVTDAQSSSGTYTLAYAFTPDTDLTVTHVRSMSGFKVSIWTDDGTLIIAQNVSGPSGTWTDTPLPSPLLLPAGQTYRIGFWTGSSGSTYFYSTNRPPAFTNGTIVNGYYYSSGDWFPNSFYNGDRNVFLCDLRYTAGALSNVPTSIAVAGPFVSGAWAGPISVLAPASNMVLHASDLNGHVGNSDPFNVEVRDDISVLVEDAPDPVAPGGLITYRITVTNVGPSSATGAFLTNTVPPSTVVESVTTTRGTCTVTGAVVSCDFGTLAPDQSAIVTIRAQIPGSVAAATPSLDSAFRVPSSALEDSALERPLGSYALTNTATIHRSGPDSLLANNTAEAITWVEPPVVSVGSISVVEGHSSFASAEFVVSISVPPATNVIVAYATVNGTAEAGTDYTAAGGVLIFAPGETNLSVVVPVIGDTNNEPHETFSLVLTAVTNAAIGVSNGLCTIVNDDVGPFYDDFEPGIDSTQWAAFGGTPGFTVLATNYGGSVSGVNSLWFGDAGERSAASRPINTSLGGAITFNLRFSNGSAEPWEQLDLPTEGVILEYSLNGTTWTGMGLYTNATFYNWTAVTANIPASAQSIATQFRWRQLTHSGTCCDHWALDDVNAAVGPQPPTIITQPASRTVPTGALATLSAAATGSTPLSYQWYKQSSAALTDSALKGVPSSAFKQTPERPNNSPSPLNGERAGVRGENTQDASFKQKSDFEFDTNLAMPIPGATNATLTLPSVTTNDSGSYHLVVTNLYGSATSAPAQLSVIEVGPGSQFRIVSLGTTGASIFEHGPLTGDDRGGIAISDSVVLYTGDNSTARFGVNSLSTAASLGVVYEALVSDLASGTIYSLAYGSVPLTSSGGTVNSLVMHDPATGLATGTVIPLSQSFFVPIGSGIFAGYGRVVIHTVSRVYDISLPSGVVTDRGAMASPTHVSTESWAWWGVAEYYGGTVYLVYVQNSVAIARASVPSGAVSIVSTFSNLSDMASFTVSPNLSRWYFHHEGISQFGGSDETIGYANAVFSFTAPPPPTNPPVITVHPAGRTVLPGDPVTFSVTATGAPPLFYQWRHNGSNIAGAATSSYAISAVQSNHIGGYSVVVTNSYGSATSLVATLNLQPSPFTILSAANTTLTLENAAARIHSLRFQSNELYRVGTFVSDWGLQLGTNTATFRRNANSGAATDIPMVLVSADATSAAWSGLWPAGGASLRITRDYALVGSGDTLRITTALRNDGASAVQVRCFESMDVDWSSGTTNSFATVNDRYTILSNGVSILAGRSSFTNTPLTVAIGTIDPGAILSASATAYWGINNGQELNSFFASAGADSQGSVVDAPIDIAREFSIAPGASVSFTWCKSIATSLPAAEAGLVRFFGSNAPLRLTSSPFPNGVRIRALSSDASPLTPDRLPLIHFYRADALVPPLTNWVRLTNPPVLTNGMLDLIISPATNRPGEFYRVMEIK